MTNEYGVRLDSNGYAPSVVDYYGTVFERCFLCDWKAIWCGMRSSTQATGRSQRHTVCGCFCVRDATCTSMTIRTKRSS